MRISSPTLACTFFATLVACGDRGSGEPECVADSTYELVQFVFETRGCTPGACHGQPAETAEGGLDLRRDDAYANLVNVLGESADLVRVFPGDDRRSLLYLKLAARTDGIDLVSLGIDGSSMPITGDALTDGELTLIREWILSGAPRTGVVADAVGLLEYNPKKGTAPFSKGSNSPASLKLNRPVNP